MTLQFVAVGCKYKGLYCAQCIKLKLILNIMTAEFFPLEMNL